MTTRAQTTTVLRRGGRLAYLSGAAAAIGLLMWFTRFAFPDSVIGWLNDVLVMIQYALAVPIVVALHKLLSRLATGDAVPAVLYLPTLLVGLALLLGWS